MIHIDAGNKCDICRYDIDGIQSSAKAHLKNLNIQRFRPENIQGCQGTEFKKTEGCLPPCLINLIETLDDSGIIHRLT